MSGKKHLPKIGKSIALMVAGYLVAAYALPFAFPIPAQLETAPQAGLEFTDRHGVPLRRLLSEDQKIAKPARLDEIPSALIRATLDAEDMRFFDHNGLDYLGIGRAARDLVVRRRVVSGASTITQQLVKITSPPRPRNFWTKIIEAFTARHVEMRMSKDEILVAYLNRLPYGNLYTGCRQAADGYFGKPLADLSIAESALLAALPNQPSRLNPYRNPTGAEKRQQWVLARMRINGSISQEQHEVALAERWLLQPRTSRFQAPHLIGLLPPPAGVDRVKTTIDLTLQNEIETIAASHISTLGDRVHAAVVVIANDTGEVLTLTGSRDWSAPDGGQHNGAWTPRSPGSTLKPFTYLLALERGKTGGSILADVPSEFPTPEGPWRPVNFSRRFYGPVTLRHALANSLNVPAVRELNALGGPAVLHRSLQDHLGLTSLGSDPDHAGLGLTLGGQEVRLLELTNAYATLARLGRHLPYRLEISPSLAPVAMTTVFDADAAFILADILSDNEARATAFGLNSPLRLPFRAAAKTGTSTDFRDNWTLGFTPEFTVGVWVGRFDNTPLMHVTGATGAAPIFHRVLSRLHRDLPPTWYPMPDSIVERQIHPLTGKLVADGGDREIFLRSNLPPTMASSDFDSDGRVLLPSVFREWVASSENHLRPEVSLARIEVDPAPLEILSPSPGTIAYLDPDLPSGGKKFPLRHSSSASVDWSSSSLLLENGYAILVPGTHRITATTASGQIATTEITVETL